MKTSTKKTRMKTCCVFFSLKVNILQHHDFKYILKDLPNHSCGNNEFYDIYIKFQTGTVILGCLGIILFVLALVPHTIILQNHDFYINHFVMHQRSEGIRDLRDTEIPEIEHFSKIASGILVAYDTVFIFSSIFLIAGIKNLN